MLGVTIAKLLSSWKFWVICICAMGVASKVADENKETKKQLMVLGVCAWVFCISVVGLVATIFGGVINYEGTFDAKESSAERILIRDYNEIENGLEESCYATVTPQNKLTGKQKLALATAKSADLVDVTITTEEETKTQNLKSYKDGYTVKGSWVKKIEESRTECIVYPLYSMNGINIGTVDVVEEKSIEDFSGQESE